MSRDFSQQVNNGNICSVQIGTFFFIYSKIIEENISKIRKIININDIPLKIISNDSSLFETVVKINTIEKKLLKNNIMCARKKKDSSYMYISELNSINIELKKYHYLDNIQEPLVEIRINKKIKQFENFSFNEISEEKPIIKVINEKPFYLKKRGSICNEPLEIKNSKIDIIATGGDISNAFCVTKGKFCYLGQPLNDLGNINNFVNLQNNIISLIKKKGSDPNIVAIDKHPDYFSSKIGIDFADKNELQLIKIQHHKAHVAGVALEHKLKNYIGFSLDGLGFGDDKTIWGGEVFDVSNEKDFNRVGHLEEQLQLGDTATVNPGKMLISILMKFMSKKEILKLKIFKEDELNLVYNAIKNKFNTISTTSCGRVFDAASFLLGFCDKMTYDGRPAMILESKATQPYNIKPIIQKIDGKYILLTSHMFEYLVNNIEKDKNKLAATVFHYIANGLLEIGKKYNKQIVASGGVLYNEIINKIFQENNVKLNKKIPPGDGGLAYGQAYLASLAINDDGENV